MKWQMELQDSELSLVREIAGTLSLQFLQAKIITEQSEPKRLSVTITIFKPKYSKLPKVGRLTDGELYGVMGKPLNGRIPINFSFNKACELVLSVEDKDYSIEGAGISLTIDGDLHLN